MVFVSIKHHTRYIMSGIDQIRNILCTAKGDPINVCSAIYEIILNDEAYSGQLLQFLCKNYERITSTEEMEVKEEFSIGEKIDYRNKYGTIVDGLLEKMFCEKLNEEEFYNTLWKRISMLDIFENKKSRYFALYYILIDGRIPYYELEPSISVPQEEYMEIVDKLYEKEQKARFIMLSDFEQWSEVSYLLLQILDEINDPKEKAVFLSRMFQTREKIILNNLREISE